MRIAKNDEFIEWAATRGIGFDLRYSAPQSLIFRDANGRPSHSSRLEEPVPENSAERVRLIVRVLDRFRNNAFWVWRRGGVWPNHAKRLDGARDWIHEGLVQLRGKLGIAADSECAIRFDETEHALAIAIVVMETMSCGSVRDDLFVIPETGDQLLYFDHHEMIYIFDGPKN